MNGFLLLFGDSIHRFWDEMPEKEVQKLFANVLSYANANPSAFKREIAEVQFDKDLQPLPIVLEALSRDTDTWGQFYVDLMETVFTRAKNSKDPQVVVDHLIEYAVIEKQPKPFVMQIANRLYRELFSDNIVTKCAAISMLPRYLHNPAIENQKVMVRELQNKLINPKWRIRYMSFISLRKVNLLPKGYTLSFTDVLYRIYYGKPYTF